MRVWAAPPLKGRATGKAGRLAAAVRLGATAAEGRGEWANGQQKQQRRRMGVQRRAFDGRAVQVGTCLMVSAVAAL